MLTLRWDRFTGFDRYYALENATAERDAARAELRSVQLNASTAVWTAYYDFRSARARNHHRSDRRRGRPDGGTLYAHPN